MEHNNLIINVKPEKIVPFHTPVYHVPINSQVDIFIETEEIILSLSMGKPIEVHFDENMDTHLSYRILDFMCGIVYAYNGTVEKTSENNFVFYPCENNSKFV